VLVRRGLLAFQHWANPKQDLPIKYKQVLLLVICNARNWNLASHYPTRDMVGGVKLLSFHCRGTTTMRHRWPLRMGSRATRDRTEEVQLVQTQLHAPRTPATAAFTFFRRQLTISKVVVTAPRYAFSPVLLRKSRNPTVSQVVVVVAVSPNQPAASRDSAVQPHVLVTTAYIRGSSPSRTTSQRPTSGAQFRVEPSRRPRHWH
jgi:hypothetical protein